MLDNEFRATYHPSYQGAVNMPTLSIPAHVRLRIAAAADVDPRTVKKFCEGKDVKGRPGERIERALREAKLLKDEAGGGQ